MRKKKLCRLLVASITMLLIVCFCSAYALQKKCGRCLKLEHAIIQVLTIIEEDNQDYVLDVLSETDEWNTLYELLNESNIIRDSTYHKLRTVFPDLPAKQAPQWK